MDDKQDLRVAVEGNVAGDVAVAGRDINIDRRTIFEGTISKDDKLALRNRRVLLDKVQTFWVEGVLEKSLFGENLIRLGLELSPDVVDHPWEVVLDTLEQEPGAVPQGTSIINVLDQTGSSLLILGAPGSGKTTMLLELARDAIQRAGDDLDAPVPVVFNLSSWTRKQTIEEWLVAELNEKYGVPRRLGTCLVENQELMLLLDGLDEAHESRRDDCIRAINVFRKNYGLSQIIVCSRTAEYREINDRLEFEGAVILQPLRPDQIDTYLAQAGDQLNAVRSLLEDDEPLQEIIQSPLMLSVIMLAYSDLSTVDLEQLDTLEARRIHLFDTYIARMLKRRKDSRFDDTQIKRWLAWIARKINQHTQSIFLIERIQPSWLEDNERIWYRVGVLLLGFLAGLIFGVAYALGVAWLRDIRAGLPGWLLVGAIGGVLVGIISAARREITSIEKIDWSWKAVQHRLIGRTLRGALIGGLFLGLLTAIIFGVQAAMNYDPEAFEVYGMPFIDSELAYGLSSGLYAGFIGGGYGAIYGAILMALGGGLRHSKIDQTIKPNQGIRQSALYAFIGTVTAGALGSLIVGQIFEKFGGVYAGLAFGLWFGGLAVIQHIVLRLILTLKGRMPANYADFLDHAVELVFLRSVGGGYIFIHRMLLDHFASMDET